MFFYDLSVPLGSFCVKGLGRYVYRDSISLRGVRRLFVWTPARVRTWTVLHLYCACTEGDGNIIYICGVYVYIPSPPPPRARERERKGKVEKEKVFKKSKEKEKRKGQEE